MSLASMSNRISLDMVARACGVSKSSASRALSLDADACPLSPTTRELIRGRAREMGYRPNLLAVSLSKHSAPDAKNHLVQLEFDPRHDDLGPTSTVMKRVRSAIAQGQWPVLVAVAAQVEDAPVEASDEAVHTAWKSDASWD